MTVKSGALRHQITWFKAPNPEANQNTRGAPPRIGDKQFTVWASVEALTGRELVTAGQLEGDIQYRVKMRYRAGVRPDWYFTWQGRIFNPTEPPRDPDGRDAELEFLAREFVPG